MLCFVEKKNRRDGNKRKIIWKKKETVKIKLDVGLLGWWEIERNKIKNDKLVKILLYP